MNYNERENEEGRKNEWANERMTCMKGNEKKCNGKWMKDWMNDWMNEGRKEWVSEWRNERMNEWMHGWMK